MSAANDPAGIDLNSLDQDIAELVHDRLRYLAKRAEGSAVHYRDMKSPMLRNRAYEYAEIARRWHQLADAVAAGLLAQLDYDAVKDQT